MDIDEPKELIRAQRVVFPDGVRPASVLVSGEKIVAVGEYDDDLGGAEVIAVPDDQVLMPGMVDSHVHVNEPGRTQWEGYLSATRAARAGGITTILDMPLNSNPPTTTVANLSDKLAATEGKLSVDTGFWGGAVPGNIDQLAPMWEQGVFGFKSFTAYSGIDEFGYLDYGQLEDALAEIARIGAVLIVHAEDSSVLDACARDCGRSYSQYLASRPKVAENGAISRVLQAAEETGARVHILHLSSAQALPTIRAAKSRGVRVTVETCPHYLTFAAEEIPDGAPQYKCAPPIRDEKNRLALWAGLLDGTIDEIASDHSPCTKDLKNLDTGDIGAAWGGIASVQLGFPAIWTAGKEFGIQLNDVARWFAETPSKNFGIGGKGSIKAGNDADFAIVDPDAEFTVDVNLLEQKNKISPYHGRTLRGVVKHTMLRGEFVDRDSLHGHRIYRAKVPAQAASA